jgi:hypothetical protein
VLLPLWSARNIYTYIRAGGHWGLLCVHLSSSWIGLMSIWYHAQLSLAGQLMDEWAILWALHITFAVVWPYLVVLPDAVRSQ